MESLLQLIVLAAAITGLFVTFRASFLLGLICLILVGVPFALIGFSSGLVSTCLQRWCAD